MGKWRHFSDEEAQGLDGELMSKLDVARELCGFPIVITSGRRTAEQSPAARVASRSSHQSGHAAHDRAPTGQNEREKMI